MFIYGSVAIGLPNMALLIWSPPSPLIPSIGGIIVGILKVLCVVLVISDNA
jgi:hypothetical protein